MRRVAVGGRRWRRAAERRAGATGGGGQRGRRGRSGVGLTMGGERRGGGDGHGSGATGDGLFLALASPRLVLRFAQEATPAVARASS